MERMLHRQLLVLAVTLGIAMAGAHADTLPAKPTMTEVLEQAGAADWRALDDENTLYLELASGRVIIELAPVLAPQHAANIRALAREKYFDGLAILRSQDNYVVQWGDPESGSDKQKALLRAKRSLPAEFTVAYGDNFPFSRHPDVDGYAPEVGFSQGFAVGRDPQAKQAWLAHCYGAVGVGRDVAADSGGGTELYVVIGNAPRHLDRNITVVGRVVQGMEWLSTLPRGTGALGFYERPEQRVPIRSVRVAADLPKQQRTALQVLRTDTLTWSRLVETRRNRYDAWYKRPAGHVELCNVPVPVRPAPMPPAPPPAE